MIGRSDAQSLQLAITLDELRRFVRPVQLIGTRNRDETSNEIRPTLTMAVPIRTVEPCRRLAVGRL
jgi:hypothetical protein